MRKLIDLSSDSSTRGVGSVQCVARPLGGILEKQQSELTMAGFRSRCCSYLLWQSSSADQAVVGGARNWYLSKDSDGVTNPRGDG